MMTSIILENKATNLIPVRVLKVAFYFCFWRVIEEGYIKLSSALIMETRVIEFLVDQALIQDNYLSIQGACNKGPIHQGDTFSLAYKVEIVSIGSENPNTERLDIRKVQLYVKTIITYRREVDELYPGMTGELFVVGKGGEVVTSGDRLGI